MQLLLLGLLAVATQLLLSHQVVVATQLLLSHQVVVATQLQVFPHADATPHLLLVVDQEAASSLEAADRN